MKPGDARAAIYLPHVQSKTPAVCFVTVGELLFGAYKKKWGTAKLQDLQERLRRVVIVPYDLAICETYASLKVQLQAKGKCVADNDLWIAACAVRHSLPLVSNNRAHFEDIPELVLISEAPAVKELTLQPPLPGIGNQEES